MSDWLTSKKVTEITSVLGNIGYGKSYSVGKMQEIYCNNDWPFCCIDRMGIHYVIRAVHDDVIIVGGDHGDIEIEDIGDYIEEILDKDLRFIVDVSNLSDEAATMFVGELFVYLYDWHKVNKKPRNYMIEECDFFIPQVGGDKECKRKIVKCITKGRMNGFGFTLLSQRYAMVTKEALEQTRNYMIFNMKGKNDLNLVRQLTGTDISLQIRMLKEGKCIILTDGGYTNYSVGKKVSPEGAPTPQVGQTLQSIKVLELNKSIKSLLDLRGE